MTGGLLEAVQMLSRGSPGGDLRGGAGANRGFLGRGSATLAVLLGAEDVSVVRPSG